MQLTTSQAKSLMRKLEIEVTSCTHHVRGFLVVDDVKIFPVHCSFGNKDLPGRVPHLFRKSLKLSIEEFELFRKCSMSREQYIDLLRHKGVIS